MKNKQLFEYIILHHSPETGTILIGGIERLLASNIDQAKVLANFEIPVSLRDKLEEVQVQVRSFIQPTNLGAISTSSNSTAMLGTGITRTF